MNLVSRFVCLLIFSSIGLLAQTDNPNPQKSNSKISSDLLLVSKIIKKQPASDLSIELNLEAILRKGNMVRVEALAKRNGSSLADDFMLLGAEEVDVHKRMVNAWLPINSIEKLQELESLQWVKPVYKPLTNIGSVDSEGDSALAAGLVRQNYCVNGAGINVGVMSDSYNFLSGAASGVATGDLPGIGNPNGYVTPVTVVSDYSSGSDEGRAMCEIVHDLAPGSSLFYATAFGGQATFSNNIFSLAYTHNCDIIVDDIYYFEEPMYMDGMIAQACDSVVGDGITYFSAIGNSAQSSYESSFRTTAGNNFHDFDPGPGVDNFQSITVNAGSSIKLTLQWDDPWGSLTPNSAQTDMDLHIYDENGSTLFLSSIRDNINVTFDPTEFISATANGTGTVTFSIAIEKHAGPSPSSMKWVINGASGVIINEYLPSSVTERATSNGHANSEGAIAVGACAWFSSPAYGVNPPLPEPFTSYGGVQIRYDLNGNSISPIIRSKPEITASDGVSNTFFGGSNNFFGTSAAAPHAAAVAALLKQVDQNLTPAQIESVLQNSAIDMSTSGFDYLTGAGLIQADSAMREVYSNLCNISSIQVESGPVLDPGDTTYTVGLRVKYVGFTCMDSLILYGQKFEITDPDSMDLMFSGLPADGLPVDVTASFSSSSGCLLSEVALYTAPISQQALDTLVITEIMYNPPESGTDSLEYIEIYNPTASSIDMTGFYFSQGVNYTFGSQTISSGGYILVCEDSTALFNQFGVSAFQWSSGALTNSGEDIVLKDSNGNTIDSVDYDDSSPWPLGAGGEGPSIVLCNPTSDNGLGANWTESTSLTGVTINGYPLKGSPGAADAACGPCPIPDSTFAMNTTCDSALAGVWSTLHSGVGGCDSVHTLTVTYTEGDSVVLTALQICSGDSMLIFGQWQNASGLYYDMNLNVGGCDSITVQELEVNPVHNTSLSVLSICYGDSAFFFGEWRSAAGVYYDSLTTVSGCDSILSQELLVDSLISTTASSTICMGDSILIFGFWEFSAGTYSDTALTSQGCDSVHSITLSVLPMATGSLSVSICEGDSMLIGGMYYKLSGAYYDTLSAANSCDSIVNVSLSVNPLDTTYQNLTTSNAAMAGVFDTTYTNVLGCDSTVIYTVSYVPPAALDTLVITEVMYNPPESGTDIHEYIEIYNPSASPINLQGFTMSDAVSYTFGNTSIPAMGYIVVCKDSVALYGQFNISAFEWSGSLVNSGELILLKDANGNTLDSVDYSNSGAWPSGADGDGPSIVLCDWTTDNALGANWTESTTNTGVFINGYEFKGSPGTDDVACGFCTSVDSITVYNVTCDSALAGTSVLNLTNSKGCDSVVTNIITYDQGNTTSLASKTICSGDSVLVFGKYESMAGTYADTLSTVNGCDSIVSCKLIVNPQYFDSKNEEICAGDSIKLGGQFQTTGGIYYDSLLTIQGCDSVIMTMLSVRTDSGCGLSIGDSILVVTDNGWMKSTVTNTAEAGGYPWLGVSSLPPVATYTLPAQIGQPKPYHSIDSVEGAMVFKSGNGVTFFRTTFEVTIDTGVSAQFRSFMDDGMEIYINGKMIAREDDRDVVNSGGDQHHLKIKQNGDRENGAEGDQEFDLVNNYRMDSLVHVGTNELVIALRNAPKSTDNGGFSFRMDMRTGEAYMPALTGYIVSDADWMQSTSTTPGGASWNWSGVNTLPLANTFTKEAVLGQPYGWYSTEEVEGSYAIKADADVRYYRRRFNLVDSSDVNVRIRSTFDENIMVFINDSLVAGHYQHGLGNRSLAGHDVSFPSGGVVDNGYLGGDAFMQVENVDFNQILRKGNNYITVALQNRANDKGGFSLRLDMDKAGNPVIRKNTPDDGQAGGYFNDLSLDFELYPNPTAGLVNIDLIESPSGDNQIIVTDVNGKILISRSLVNPETGRMDLDVSALPSGMYIVRIRSGGIFKGKPLLRF